MKTVSRKTLAGLLLAGVAPMAIGLTTLPPAFAQAPAPVEAPVDALLRANVGYLAIERGAGLDTLADEAAAAGMPVIADTPHLLVVEAPRASPLPDPQLTDAQRAGWGLTLGTWFLGLMGVGRVSQKWLRTGPYSLVRLRS